MKKIRLYSALLLISCIVIFCYNTYHKSIDFSQFNHDSIQIDSSNYDIYYKDFENDSQSEIYITNSNHIIYKKIYKDATYATASLYSDVNSDGNNEIFIILNDIYSTFGAKNLLALSFDGNGFIEIPNKLYDQTGNILYDFSDLNTANAPSFIEVTAFNNESCLKLSFLNELQNGYTVYYVKLSNNTWRIIYSDTEYF